MSQLHRAGSKVLFHHLHIESLMDISLSSSTYYLYLITSSRLLSTLSAHVGFTAANHQGDS